MDIKDFNTLKSIKTVTINAGQTDSDIVPIFDENLVGLIIPDNYTAADIAFYGSVDDPNTVKAITRDDGTAYGVKATVDKITLIRPVDLSCINYIQLRTTVAQLEKITIKLIVREI